MSSKPTYKELQQRVKDLEALEVDRERAMHNCARRYDELLRAVTDYTYTVTIENGAVVKTAHSSACVGITGYSSEEYDAKPYLWLNMIHPEDRDVVLKRTSDIIAGHDSSVIEHRIYHKDGSIRWVKNTIVRRYNINNQLDAYDGLVRDITNRKRVEKALQASEGELRAIIDNSATGITVSDLNGKILRTNPAHQKMFGYSPDELETMTFSDFTHHEDIGKHKATYDRLISGEIDHYNMSKRFVHKDGHIVWTQVAVSLIRDNANKPLFAVGIVEDITDRMQAEERLRKSEERFALAVSGTNDGIWDWDVKTNINYFSPRFCELLGYGPDELKNDFNTWKSSLHPDDQDRIVDHVRQHIEQQAPYDVEYRLRKKNGEYCWFHARGQAIWDEAGKPIRMAGSITDISRRRKNEKEKEELYLTLKSLWGLAENAGNDLKIICDKALAEIVSNTSSLYGFYGFVNDDESLLTVHSWSSEVMKDCSTADKPLEYSIQKAGIWSEAIRRRAPYVINEYAKEHSGKKRLPKGHVTLTKILSVPIINDGKIVAVGVVANKATDYTEEDIEKIRAFLLNAHIIMSRKQAELEREQLVGELQTALNEIKTLRGIIPICSYCKKIRGDKGAWDIIEAYISEHTHAEFSHGVCPDCYTRLMKELELED